MQNGLLRHSRGSTYPWCHPAPRAPHARGLSPTAARSPGAAERNGAARWTGAGRRRTAVCAARHVHRVVRRLAPNPPPCGVRVACGLA
ncbi:hypothetical protein HBB16_04740 [Pseudonocardia sp. MCCB 268]|nr:hypothetical protein [Pseudonocardia cytotoxica]